MSNGIGRFQRNGNGNEVYKIPKQDFVRLKILIYNIGLTGTGLLFRYTSLLSISDSSINRTHIIFQNSDGRIERYDYASMGSNLRLTGTTVLYSATIGTRLTTWANSGSCKQSVSVYYQRDNTSDLYYATFQDSCYYYTNSCSVTDSGWDLTMPLVRTYRKNAGHNAGHRKHPSGAAIFGVVLAVIILCCIRG